MPDKPARKAPAPGAQRWERLVAASESSGAVEEETIASEETDEEAGADAPSPAGREEARAVAGGARQRAAAPAAGQRREATRGARAASRSDSSSSSSSSDDSGDEEEPRAREAGMRPRRGTREYGGGRAGSPMAGGARVRAGWRSASSESADEDADAEADASGGRGESSPAAASAFSPELFSDDDGSQGSGGGAIRTAQAHYERARDYWAAQFKDRQTFEAMLSECDEALGALERERLSPKPLKRNLIMFKRRAERELRPARPPSPVSRRRSRPEPGPEPEPEPSLASESSESEPEPESQPSAPRRSRHSAGAGALARAPAARLREERPRAQLRLEPAAETADRRRPSPSDPQRRSLSRMKVSALVQRAEAEGVDEAALQAAYDSDNIKDAVIELILTKLRPVFVRPEATETIVDRLFEEGRASNEAAERRLREELGPMKVSALKKRADDAGVAEERILAALDESDISGSLVALIVEKELPTSKPREEAAYRAELAAMPRSAVVQRAKAAGVDDAQLDEALDLADPDDIQAAAIELIMQARQQRGGERDRVKPAQNSSAWRVRPQHGADGIMRKAKRYLVDGQRHRLNFTTSRSGGVWQRGDSLTREDAATQAIESGLRVLGKPWDAPSQALQDELRKTRAELRRVLNGDAIIVKAKRALKEGEAVGHSAMLNYCSGAEKVSGASDEASRVLSDKLAQRRVVFLRLLKDHHKTILREATRKYQEGIAAQEAAQSLDGHGAAMRAFEAALAELGQPWDRPSQTLQTELKSRRTGIRQLLTLPDDDESEESGSERSEAVFMRSGTPRSPRKAMHEAEQSLAANDVRSISAL